MPEFQRTRTLKIYNFSRSGEKSPSFSVAILNRASIALASRKKSPIDAECVRGRSRSHLFRSLIQSRLNCRARWRENRTIFNTPNARLMNVSLLRENKLLHAQERRGSRASVRAPSRQPSMASLRAHSPNASQGAKHSHHSQHRMSRTGFYHSLTKQATCLYRSLVRIEQATLLSAARYFIWDTARWFTV